MYVSKTADGNVPSFQGMTNITHSVLNFRSSSSAKNQTMCRPLSQIPYGEGLLPMNPISKLYDYALLNTHECLFNTNMATFICGG